MSSKGDLAVSLAGLSDLATQLKSIKDRMNDTGQVDRYLGNGDLGNNDAHGALTGFMHGWRDGRKEINGGLDSVSGMAQSVVEELTKTDEDLKNELLKHTGGGQPT